MSNITAQQYRDMLQRIADNQISIILCSPDEYRQLRHLAGCGLIVDDPYAVCPSITASGLRVLGDDVRAALTYRDLQDELRVGLTAGKTSKVQYPWQAVRPYSLDLRLFGGAKHHDLSSAEENRLYDARAYAYNAGVYHARGYRADALTLWHNAIFVGRPDGYVRRPRKGERHV